MRLLVPTLLYVAALTIFSTELYGGLSPIGAYVSPEKYNPRVVEFLLLVCFVVSLILTTNQTKFRLLALGVVFSVLILTTVKYEEIIWCKITHMTSYGYFFCLIMYRFIKVIQQKYKPLQIANS